MPTSQDWEALRKQEDSLLVSRLGLFLSAETFLFGFATLDSTRNKWALAIVALVLGVVWLVVVVRHLAFYGFVASKVAETPQAKAVHEWKSRSWPFRLTGHGLGVKVLPITCYVPIAVLLLAWVLLFLCE